MYRKNNLAYSDNKHEIAKKSYPASPICPLCQDQIELTVIEGVIKSNNKYNVYNCTSCQIWVTHPFPTREELARLYSTGNYRTKTGKRFNPVLEYIIHLLTVRKRKRIERYRDHGRILDIGCGRGLFLHIMQEDGWEVAGQEFSETSASYASDIYGIDVRTGELKDCEYESESFDVVNINHVLEHLENPDEVIAECYRILKKGGLLVTAVPNIDSLQGFFGQKHWFQLDLPCHLYHFSTKSLFDLLTKNSFKVELARHFKFEYNPFGWLQTLYNASGIRENILYDLLKSSDLRKKDHDTSPILDYLKTFILMPLYLPLSLMLSIIEAIIKKGGTIEVYSIKKEPV
jgi:2-polyprenyl-3-methyl-5-hydroxy-6-metoxy-1,4-benzoquinol methylase